MVYRVFLSSPGDVDPERDAAERVVARINAEHPGSPPFELVRWEQSFYTAAQTFQTQIPRPSACDLVVCVFWKRLGSDLPEQFRREDGSLPTGTEFEFEDALQRATADANKVPDILVYRKNDKVYFDAETADLEKAQRDRFLAFWNKWFRNEKGHFVAAFHSFLGSTQFESLFEDHLRQWLTRHAQGVTWTRGSPFRGLESFDVEHAPIYFGRRYDVERARARLMTNALAGNSFLLVIGPSGAGKSSLARAGLIPRLTQPGALGEIAGHARWLAVTPALLKPEPGRGWGAKLAEMFFAGDLLGKPLSEGDFDTPEKLARLMEKSGEESALPFSRALQRLGPKTSEGSAPGSKHALIILVDQLERLFQWEAADAARFAAFLQSVAQSPGILVLATMRSDYLHRMAEMPELAQLIADKALQGPGDASHVLDIGFPSPSDLREMILGPAKAAGLAFELDPQTKTDLGRQVEHDADPESLPVLAFLLKELYERRSGNSLTWAAYKEIGGLAGALTMQGEAVLADKEAADAFPYLVRQLTAFGGHPPQAYAVQMAEESLKSEPAALRLATLLTDAGLLVSDQRQLRLAHDTLLTKWKRLADQVDADRRNLEARERLSQLFQRFKQKENSEPVKARDYYLEGFPLEEGRNLLADWGESAVDAQSPGLVAYITQSARRKKSREQRRIGVALVLASVLGALFIAAAWFYHQNSESQRLADIRLQLTRVESAMRAQDYDRAVGLAIKAHELADNEDTRSALLSALVEQSPHLETIANMPATIALWIDEHQLVLVAANGEAALATPAGAQPLEILKEPLAKSPALAGIPDGAGGFVLAQSDGGVLHAKKDSTIDKLAGIGGLDARFAHQADLQITGGIVQLAISDGYSNAMLRRCSSLSLQDCKDTDLGKRGTAVAIAPGGNALALSENGDGGARLWLYDLGAVDVAGSARDLLPLEADGTSLDWSGDGRLLALGRRDGMLQLLNVTAQPASPVWTYKPSQYPVISLSWSHSGNALAFNCGASQVCLAEEPDKSQGQNFQLLSGSKGTVAYLTWDPRGVGLLSLHGQSEVRYWRKTPQHPVTKLLPVASQSGLVTLASDTRRHRLAIGDERGNVWIGQLEEARAWAPVKLPSQLGRVSSLAFAADGALAIGHANGPASIQTGTEPPRPECSIDIALRLAWTSDGQAVVAPLNSGNDLAVLSRSCVKGSLEVPDNIPRADGIIGGPSGTVMTSHTDGSLRSWNIASKESQTLFDASIVADHGSALSLALDESERWLAATRLDDKLKIYDLKQGRPPVSVPLRNSDTKVVAFSPANDMLAALGSDGMLYVWQFDPQAGSLSPLVSAFPIPERLDRKDNTFGQRRAAWLAWAGDTEIAIATNSGEVVIVSVVPASWQDRLRQLGQIGRIERLLE